jgi:hypothetical protein
MRAACRIMPRGDEASSAQLRSKRANATGRENAGRHSRGPNAARRCQRRASTPGKARRLRPAGATGFGRQAWRDLFGDPQQHRFELAPIDTVRGHQGADERIGQRAAQRQFLTFRSHEMSLHLVAAMHRAHASAG